MRDTTCDLHTHSTVSDGTCAPAELVRRAHRLGVSALSLTDHDAIGGLAEAEAEARALGIDFLRGVEISAEAEGVDVHILGYGFDPQDPALLAELARIRRRREERIPRMVARLRDLGIELGSRDVLRSAGGGSIGRPHVARALVALGVCRSVDDAFDRFLRAGAPGFVPKRVPTAAEAIARIRAAGGIAVLAHPLYASRNRPGGLEALVAALARHGLGGIETHYVSHRPRDRRRVERVARLGQPIHESDALHLLRAPRLAGERELHG
ncbi:MAG: PHP domain-containing protein, partial [Deltaproteobacteria bacterium]